MFFTDWFCRQELISAITEQVFKQMACILFEEHWQVFALLVTIQRMASNQSFTEDELLIFVNDVKHVKFVMSVNPKDKPDWMKHEVNTNAGQSYAMF